LVWIAEDIQRFAGTIGFADSVKQTKLFDAIKLMRKYGSFDAAGRWTLLYEKRSHNWVRRQTVPS